MKWCGMMGRMPHAALIVTAASLCFAVRPAAAQQPPPPAPLTLAEALSLALDNDPALAAVRLRRAIDLANLGMAGERPNPELRYEHTNEAPHDLVSVAQPLEVGGQRGRRVAAAGAALRTGEAELAQ